MSYDPAWNLLSPSELAIVIARYGASAVPTIDRRATRIAEAGRISTAPKPAPARQQIPAWEPSARPKPQPDPRRFGRTPRDWSVVNWAERDTAIAAQMGVSHTSAARARRRIGRQPPEHYSFEGEQAEADIVRRWRAGATLHEIADAYDAGYGPIQRIIARCTSRAERRAGQIAKSSATQARRAAIRAEHGVRPKDRAAA